MRKFKDFRFNVWTLHFYYDDDDGILEWKKKVAAKI